MTDLRKAAEMALDALRLYVTMYPQMDKGYMVDARETLRQALAQPDFDTPESHIVKWSIPVDPNNFGEPLKPNSRSGTVDEYKTLNTGEFWLVGGWYTVKSLQDVLDTHKRMNEHLRKPMQPIKEKNNA